RRLVFAGLATGEGCSAGGLVPILRSRSIGKRGLCCKRLRPEPGRISKVSLEKAELRKFRTFLSVARPALAAPHALEPRLKGDHSLGSPRDVAWIETPVVMEHARIPMGDGLDCLAKVTAREERSPQADMRRPKVIVDSKRFSERNGGLIDLSRS